MTSRKMIMQTVGAGALIALFAGGAQANLLTNGGFESPDASGGDIYCSTGWTCFNAGNFTNNTAGPGFGPVSHEPGLQSLKQFGIDAGAFQTVAVAAGTSYDLTAWAMNWVGDPLNNLGIMQLTFWDGANGTGNLLATFENFVDPIDDNVNIYLPVQDGADVTDWTQVAVSGTAPAGTVSAKVLLLHVLTPPAPGSGTVRWDDVSLTAVPVPAAVWLFGSGLVGLVGVARRKAKS
jgi:hypothetical protein